MEIVDLMQIIGGNLKKCRERAAKSVMETAKEIAYSDYRQLSRIENGTAFLPFEKIVAAANFFKCSTDDK